MIVGDAFMRPWRMYAFGTIYSDVITMIVGDAFMRPWRTVIYPA